MVYTKVTLQKGGEKMIGLQYILETNNMSVSDLANKLGIARGNIYNWFSEKRAIPSVTLEKLSDLFQFPQNFFSKELSEVEMAKVREVMADKLLDNKDKIINKTFSHRVSTLKLGISSSDDKKEREVKVLKNRKIAKAVDTLRTLFSESEDIAKLEEIFDDFNEIVGCHKVSIMVMKDILLSVSIAYGLKEADESNEFTKNFVDAIVNNENERQRKKKEVYGLIKSSKIDDLFPKV